MTTTIKVLFTQTDHKLQLQNIPGIRWFNLQDFLHEGNFWTWITFAALWMRSEGIATKNGEKAVGLFIATMLQHTGRFGKVFLSKEQCCNTVASSNLTSLDTRTLLPVPSNEISIAGKALL